MNVIRLLKPDTSRVYFKFIFIGAGANGSVAIRSFLQDARTHLNAEPKIPYSFDVMLIDGDKVENKNLDNQIFIKEDVGEYKVDVLADRYGDVYKIKVMRMTEYIKSESVLARLLNEEDIRVGTQQINVLIGLVDNNRTRQLLDRFFHSDSVRDLIYIDAGVEGVSLSEELSQLERERSGFSGQVVTGLKMEGEVILQPVGRVYSNILDDARTSFPGESCGDLIINNPQRSETNKFCAQIVNLFLNNLLDTFSIYKHYINFNAQLGGSRPSYITEDQSKKADILKK